MKKIILLLLAGVFLLVSCDDFLLTPEFVLGTLSQAYNDAMGIDVDNFYVYDDNVDVPNQVYNNGTTGEVTTTVTTLAYTFPDPALSSVVYSQTLGISSTIDDDDDTIPPQVDFSITFEIEELSEDEYENADMEKDMKLTFTFDPGPGSAVFLMRLNYNDLTIELRHPDNTDAYDIDISYADQVALLEEDYDTETADFRALVAPIVNNGIKLLPDYDKNDPYNFTTRLINLLSAQAGWSMISYAVQSIDLEDISEIVMDAELNALFE